MMIVFGTRPEVIKLAPVVAGAKQHPGIELLVCSTGQHRQMLDQAMASFGLKPDIELSLMREGQTLPQLTSALLEHMSSCIETHRPDMIVVQGDTTTAFTAALAAFYHRTAVAHVEAGLRTGDRYSPFPEEINRAMIARMATWHFTPTTQASANLRAEGITDDAIVQCGNTVIDAIGLIREQWRHTPYCGAATEWFAGRELVLVTTHRRENFGQGLENICSALRHLCHRHAHLGFVFPVHLNPQVKTVVHERLAGIPNLMMTDPVDFETSLYLQSRSRLVLTDSGGIQEEAPSFGLPCVVMREHTERSEGIAAGFAYLAGISRQAIEQAANDWLANTDRVAALQTCSNPYGDGQAAGRIIQTLVDSHAA